MRCTATAPHVSYLLGSRERAERLIDGVLVPGLIGKESGGTVNICSPASQYVYFDALSTSSRLYEILQYCAVLVRTQVISTR